MILATRGGDVAVRSTSLGRLLDSRGGGRSHGVTVSGRTVAGLPAAGAAITFSALAVASLKMRVWRGEGLDRQLGQRRAGRPASPPAPRTSASHGCLSGLRRRAA